MCLKCVLKALAAAAEEQVGLNEAEPAQLEPVETLGEQFDKAQLAREEADVNKASAEAVLAVAQAIALLKDCNQDTSGLLRMLEKLTPKAQPVESGEAAGLSDEPVNTDVDDAPMPLELRELIDKMRAAGFEVEAVRIPL